MSANKKIILILPDLLLERTDEAADALHMSRLAFIRQAIVARLQTFQSHERAVLERVLGPSGDYEYGLVMDGAIWRPEGD